MARPRLRRARAWGVAPPAPLRPVAHLLPLGPPGTGGNLFCDFQVGLFAFGLVFLFDFISFSPCTCLYSCKYENLQVQVELGL